MKILVLTSRLPYPIEKGDKLRVYHQIRELSQRHEIVLCSLVEEEPDPSFLHHLKAYCSDIHTFFLDKAGIYWSLLRGMLKGKSLQVSYFYRSHIHRQIRELVGEIQPDLVFCQLIRMSEYAKDLRVPTALDYMDCFSAGMARQAKEGKAWQRPLYERESRLLKKYQQNIYPYFNFHSIISEQDKKLLDPNEKLDLHVMPNGIDTDFFSPSPDPQPTHDLVFVGNMGYFPNIKAVQYLVQEIMPLVWEKSHTIKLLIAGARPRFGSIALGNDPRIEVGGWFEDIREAYQSGKLFVAPLFAGSGQQNKILEAMALEVPCLTTPLVNNAIHAQAGQQVELATDKEGFATKILELLQDKRQREKLGKAGRLFVQKQYNWSDSVQKLEQWASKYLPTTEEENS